jgi:Secretion system C-terminal sorting domain
MKIQLQKVAPFYWTLLALFMVNLGWGQSLHENFNYTTPGNIGGTAATNTGSNNNWSTHSSSNSGVISLVSNNLSYEGLLSSSGNRINIPGNNSTVPRDVNRATGLTGSPSVAYLSFLLNVIDNTQLGTTHVDNGYFISFGQTSGNSVTTLFSRVSIRSVNSAANYRLGINNTTSGTPTYSDFTTDLNFGTTYLVVVKYNFNGGSNDIATIWVNPSSLGGSEPSGGTTNSSGTSTSPSTFASVCIRNSSSTPNADIDEIRVGTTWASVTPKSTTWRNNAWSNGVPTSTIEAIIDENYTETTDISCKDLTINSGKTLTIGATNSLTVAGNLVNDGNLIFKSDSNGTARFASYSGAAITSSNVTVERYLPARRAWRLLTAPLKGGTGNTVAANWQGTANEGLLLFSPATYQSTTMTGYTTGGGSPNIWNYDNGWQKIANISTETMFNTNNSDTKAYLVFATGPHGSNTIANTTSAEATTLKPLGQLITGSVAHSLTADQFKLLPNPYASPINTQTMVQANAGSTIYMVDPTLNSFGGYVTFDGTNWTPSVLGNDQYIQSGQGFFVKNASNTTFTIAESHKVSGNSNTWFERTTTDTSVDKIRVLLYKQDNNSWYLADGILAVNSASGNHEVDAADADKMTNFNENIAFKNGATQLSIEYRGLPAAGMLQPMQLIGTTAQAYQMRLKTENYSNSNLTPFLENTQTGALTAIPTDGSEVVVPFTGIVATSAAPDSRFRIVYQSPLSADDLNSLVVGVYPNPVNEGLFTIELANTNAPASYTLTNLLGQEVQKGTLMALTNAIAVQDLSKGVYLLQINQEGKRFSTKLMIK